MIDHTQPGKWVITSEGGTVETVCTPEMLSVFHQVMIDELERLRAEVERLRVALKTISHGRYHKYEYDPCPYAEDIARKALEGMP